MRAACFALLCFAALGHPSNFCTDLDAVLVEPANGKFSGDAYVFKGRDYSKYNAVLDSPVSGYPVSISRGWSGLPNDIDAILTEPEAGMHAGFVWVFKGSQVWRWDAVSDMVVSGMPLNFADAFPGLPSDFYEGVDAAFAFTSGQGFAYFFKGERYAKFDLKNFMVADGGHFFIADDFPGMPSSIDAILAEPASANLSRYVYFFKGSNYWKWDVQSARAVAGYPRLIEAGWKFCAPTPPLVSAQVPEQVHLSLGKDEDSMSVAWVTGGEADAEVQWGESAAALNSKAVGDSRSFDEDPGRIWYTHVAAMTGLKANTRYYYRVGAGEHFSKVFNFMHRRSGAPYKHVIMGDLGSSNAFSLCTACDASSEICNATTCAGNISVGLVSEVGKADMVLHLGDFGYDLDSNNGTTGDNFMRNIEQVAAYVPYMVNQGNHEDSSKSLAHYVERFRSQPSNAVPSTFTSANGETTNTMYFSWNFGLVHYVSISTELFFGVTDGRTTEQSFISWLKKDLETANQNRESVPWIIVQGHRSVYCSCDGDCDGGTKKLREALEEIFMDHGVDFYINGHEHNYERSYPTYKGKSDRSNMDPNAPIYIVSGAAGSREMHEPFTREQPSWSAFRSNTFGYSILWAYNATHVHWQQIQTDPTSFPLSDYGRVIDDAWIVQRQHGPFNRSRAPLGEAFPRGVQHPRSRQFDHWWPLLGLADNGVDATDAIIRAFRAKREDTWREKLHGLMAWVGEHLGADIMWRSNASSVVHWEDVRDDGSSDCATCGSPEALKIDLRPTFV